MRVVRSHLRTRNSVYDQRWTSDIRGFSFRVLHDDLYDHQPVERFVDRDDGSGDDRSADDRRRTATLPDQRSRCGPRRP